MSIGYLLRKAAEYDEIDYKPSSDSLRILVVGVGGAGCNAIWRMKSLGLDVPTIAINTDYPHLRMVDADMKVLLKVGNGHGTGGRVDLGEMSAEMARDKIRDLFQGADVVFITAGLGGGTGTGATPVIADIARREGAMVITTVTLPFKWEKVRQARAREGLKKIMEKSNTVIVLENEKLLDVVSNRPLNDAFRVMDQLISYAIMSFVDILTKPSLINIDLADLRYIMESGNASTMLLGEGAWDDIRKIVIEALNNPLINVDYSNADGALIHMTVGEDAPLNVIYSTVDTISSFLKKNSKVSMGARVDPNYHGRMRLLVVLTGIKIPFLEEGSRKLIEEYEGEIDDIDFEVK